METGLWDSTVSCEQLNRAISYLQQLNKVPGQPRENAPVPSGIDGTYQLSRNREIELVSNLAFLSATSDNYLRVMAVCCEEHPNKMGITIRIASNTGDLASVASGFRGLARTLKRAASRVNTRAQDIETLFSEVVALDILRILSRLRSRHAPRSPKTIGKPPLTSQLSNALNDKSVWASSKLPKSTLSTLRTAAKALHATFLQLEVIANVHAKKNEAVSIITQIVIQAYQIATNINFRAALTDSQLAPDLKTHFAEALGKLGRYYAATTELICAARDRQYNLFRNIQIEPFQIPMLPAIRDRGLKVHAEIQLLLYYELHPEHVRPRTICSSKSACYLCDLFFGLHGDFLIPRTHGRIYDKWILPDWLEVPTDRRQNLGRIVVALKRTIDSQIEIRSRSRRQKVFLPNESVLMPFGTWPSSSNLSGPRDSLAASESTIRRAYSPTLRSISAGNQSCTNLPLGLLRVTDELPHSVLCIETPEDVAQPSTQAVAQLQHQKPVSVLILSQAKLPYSQLIERTSPTVCLETDRISITFDFIHGSSGRLTIIQGQECAWNKDCHLVDAEDMSTTADLQFRITSDVQVVRLRLVTKTGEAICIMIEWDE